MARPIVIVGASLAGLRAAQALRGAGHEGEVVVVGAEEQLPYTRPPLSKELLAGAHEAEQCALPSQKVDAEWRLGTRATGLDLERREVALGEAASGSRTTSSIIATGARPRRWPGPIGSTASSCCATSTTRSRCGRRSRSGRGSRSSAPASSAARSRRRRASSGST